MFIFMTLYLLYFRQPRHAEMSVAPLLQSVASYAHARATTAAIAGLTGPAHAKSGRTRLAPPHAIGLEGKIVSLDLAAFFTSWR